ncbi:MAG: zinc ABC transporter substrate-binding protein [Gammaproteobacteria bacterium]|nr:zinc ABC transporter substrate-binding protein [Gammaproteobacteria bacterium]
MGWHASRVALLMLVVISGLPLAAPADPLRVFVSVAPMQTLVAAVGGSHVEVRSLVRPGHDPHTYEPTPQQIGALTRAGLYVAVGMPFEAVWLERLRSASPGMRVVDARDGIAVRARHAHHHHHGHAGGHDDGGDPHAWTSPRHIVQMAATIRDSLIALDPVNAADYTGNHARLERDMQALDERIRALLQPYRGRKFFVFHPAWGYFADAYGLQQIAIEHDGKDPGARALVTLIEQARNEQVRVIFVQPQYDRRRAEQVAAAVGGRVVSVDPLAPDYASNLQHVAQAFAEALQR